MNSCLVSLSLLSFYLGFLFVTITTSADLTNHFEIEIKDKEDKDPSIYTKFKHGWTNQNGIWNIKTKAPSPKQNIELEKTLKLKKKDDEGIDGRQGVIPPWSSSFSTFWNDFWQPAIFGKPKHNGKHTSVEKKFQHLIPNWIERKMDKVANDKRFANQDGTWSILFDNKRDNNGKNENDDDNNDNISVIDLEISLSPIRRRTYLREGKSSKPKPKTPLLSLISNAFLPWSLKPGRFDTKDSLARNGNNRRVTRINKHVIGRQQPQHVNVNKKQRQNTHQPKHQHLQQQQLHFQQSPHPHSHQLLQQENQLHKQQKQQQQQQQEHLQTHKLQIQTPYTKFFTLKSVVQRRPSLEAQLPKKSPQNEDGLQRDEIVSSVVHDTPQSAPKDDKMDTKYNKLWSGRDLINTEDEVKSGHHKSAPRNTVRNEDDQQLVMISALKNIINNPQRKLGGFDDLIHHMEVLDKEDITKKNTIDDLDIEKEININDLDLGKYRKARPDKIYPSYTLTKRSSNLRRGEEDIVPAFGFLIKNSLPFLDRLVSKKMALDKGKLIVKKNKEALVHNESDKTSFDTTGKSNASAVKIEPKTSDGGKIVKVDYKKRSIDGNNNDKTAISRGENVDIVRGSDPVSGILKRHQREVNNGQKNEKENASTMKEGGNSQSHPIKYQNDNPHQHHSSSSSSSFSSKKGSDKMISDTLDMKQTGIHGEGDSSLKTKETHHDDSSSLNKKVNHIMNVKDAVKPPEKADAVLETKKKEEGEGDDENKKPSKTNTAEKIKKGHHRKWFGVFSIDDPIASNNKSDKSQLGPGHRRHHFHQGAIGLVIIGLMVSVVLAVSCTVSCVAGASNPGMRRVNSRTAIYSPNDYYDDNNNKENHFGFIG